LLFKSARNSSSNQSSLALALVEGQAGVAKAYRIGANLVLTKPINVEQAKGTLRVARGLLRKSVDAAPAASGKPSPAPAPSFKSENHETAAVLSAPDNFDTPELESALPAMAASEAAGAHTASVPPIEAQATSPEVQAHSIQQSSAAPEKQSTPPAHPEPIKSAVVAHSAASASAAAVAPAKESPASEKTSMAPEFVGHAQVSTTPAVPVAVEAPAFAALGVDDAPSGSGGSKKILVAAAVILVAAAIGYFGWTKLSRKNTAAPSANLQQSVPVSQPPAITPAPSSSSAVPSQSPTGATSPISKPSAAAVPSVTIDDDITAPEPVSKKPQVPALVVKSSPAAKKPAAQNEESAPQVPNPLAVAPSSDKHISNLVASAPANMPKAAPSSLKISQGVSQGLVIRKVQPRYPQNALSMRIQGSVQMEATIDKEGNVTNLKVTSGDPILARAAVEAVRQWRYKPYYLDGQPVEIQTQISVNFRLPN